MALVEEEEGWQKEERRPKNHTFTLVTHYYPLLGDGFRSTGVTGVSYGVRGKTRTTKEEWKEKSFTDF